MKIFRMHRSERGPGDPTGAMLAGGSWNPSGTPMLYTAESLSLACIEILVHLDRSQLPRDYVWSRTELNETPGFLRIENIIDVDSCQVAGRRWVLGADRLAVQVPSVVIPGEFNILLNPRHAAYNKLAWSKPQSFRFDPRLFVTEPNG